MLCPVYRAQPGDPHHGIVSMLEDVLHEDDSFIIRECLLHKGFVDIVPGPILLEFHYLQYAQPACKFSEWGLTIANVWSGKAE